MSKLISIIVPTYQHAASLPACLESILGQVGLAEIDAQLEVIVVDDGSTDDTQEILAKLSGSTSSVYPRGIPFTVITQENRGSNPARNRGLQAAQGEYVMFADADVVLKPGMLKKCLTMLAAAPSNVGYAYTGFKFGWKTFRGVPFSGKRLRRVNFVHTTCLVKKSLFPGFDETIKRFQDWDVWLTMLERGIVGVLVPGVWFDVRIDGESRIGSAWLPAFVYALPWRWLPWKPSRVAKYEAARQIMATKHKL